MTELTIDLSCYPERFASGSTNFTITKNINYIFGKNGTGKTTITDAVVTQFSSRYDVRVFKDFESVAENHSLNALALGTKNAEIQVKIDAINSDIEDIRSDISDVADNGNNLYARAEKAKTSLDRQENKISKILAESAKHIKNQTNPQIAKTSYTTRDLQNEIKHAQLLSDDEIEGCRRTVKSEKKPPIETIRLPHLNPTELINSVNHLLTSRISSQQVIKELDNNPKKQNFARMGLSIHEHSSAERCAFCGGEISERRWKLLGDYFNDNVKQFEQQIQACIEKIRDTARNIEAIEPILSTNFYVKDHKQINDLNMKIKTTKINSKQFFNILEQALREKNTHLFENMNPINPAYSENLGEIESSYNSLATESNRFSDNLVIELDRAKNRLRYDAIKRLLGKQSYETEQEILDGKKSLLHDVRKELEARRAEFSKKQSEKNRLISMTQNEEEAARRINALLATTGVSSFSLELVNDLDMKQKGQYQIKGYEGSIRPITDLSRGERNIISFLYFLFSLETDNGNKQKIVILDDPMTSNDDTMQYLMMNEINKCIKSIKQSQDYFILLTHNCHFYLNVRSNSSQYNSYNKDGNFHLLSDGRRTTIKPITCRDEDFETNYDLLWKELRFLYDQNKPDLMLNSCRKICETYSKFNCIKDFYDSSKDAKKLFDVNSHSIDDLEAEQNGKTRDEIKDMLEVLFENNKSCEHFTTHWK